MRNYSSIVSLYMFARFGRVTGALYALPYAIVNPSTFTL